VCVFVCVCVSTTTAVIKGIVHQQTKKVDMKFDTFLKRKKVYLFIYFIFKMQTKNGSHNKIFFLYMKNSSHKAVSFHNYA